MNINESLPLMYSFLHYKTTTKLISPMKVNENDNDQNESLKKQYGNYNTCIVGGDLLT